MASDKEWQEYRDRGRSLDATLPNPIYLFDQHLRVLDQSYIQFFQERIRIEEQYIQALVGLYQKARHTDSTLDPGGEHTTLQAAWREACETLDRETEARGAFVAALRNDVVNPLTMLKESNERTKKRIKEDIKESYQSHLDYQENVLPKLKQKYIRKIQDVEEYKGLGDRPVQAGFAPIPPALPAPPPSQQQQQQQQEGSPTSLNFPFNSTQQQASAPGSPPRPPIAQPQPQSPPQNVVSTQTTSRGSMPPPPRQRSPSTSTSLTDIAQQGKKTIRAFLQDGNRPVFSAMKDGLGDRANPALKSVKAKREADEADKEYRKGVYQLETLRLRRVTIIRSGYTSLEDFLWEEGLTLQKTLQRYVDCLIGTAHTSSQLADHIQSTLDKVSLEKDRAIQTQSFGQVDAALRRALPPTLYHNYFVGDSKDLIFGTSLVDYATKRGTTGAPAVALGLARGGKSGKDGSMDKKVSEAIGLAQETVPRLVKICVADIDNRGLTTEGIYRVSGRYANVQELRHLVEKDEGAFAINPQQDDVFVVASLLKQYLRELPEPVFRLPLPERLQHSEEREKHVNSGFVVIKNKLRRLPPVHQATLRLVIEHLARVASNCQITKMDPKNLSIVFGTLLFGEDEIPKGADVLTLAHGKDTVLEDLITYAPMVFEDTFVSSPRLSAAPLAEGSPTQYTSSPIMKPVHRQSVPADKPPDFTPALPARPEQSIHPGTRHARGSSVPSVGPMSPTGRAALFPIDVAARHPVPQDTGNSSWTVIEAEPPTPPPASEKPSLPSRPSSRPPSSTGSAQSRRSLSSAPPPSDDHAENLSPMSPTAKMFKRRSGERGAFI